MQVTMRAGYLLEIKPSQATVFGMADSSFFDLRGTGNALALSKGHCSLQRVFWQTLESPETPIDSMASATPRFGTAASSDH